MNNQLYAILLVFTYNRTLVDLLTLLPGSASFRIPRLQSSAPSRLPTCLYCFLAARVLVLSASTSSRT
jgi:hypothetical protein